MSDERPEAHGEPEDSRDGSRPDRDTQGADSAPEPPPAPRRRHGLAGRWKAFRGSPFLPGCVLVLIISAAAGLFAGTYTYAMADPTPRSIPVAVVGSADNPPPAGRFVDGMEKALDSALVLDAYPTRDRANDAIESQKALALMEAREGGEITFGVSGASGAQVAQLLQQTAPKVAAKTDVRVHVTDLKPLAEGDPRGLAIFYITLAPIIVGFVGSIQMGVHARALNPVERIAFTAAYALLGGFVIAAVVSWLLDAVPLPFVHSWMILALTMFTAAMVFVMFSTLFKRWAMIPTWVVLVMLGNPSSGGAVSWPLLPSFLGAVGRWLPPGASVNAQHTAVYFEHQNLQPYLVLVAWAVVSCAVFLIWRHRHPGGRIVESAPTPSR